MFCARTLKPTFGVRGLAVRRRRVVLLARPACPWHTLWCDVRDIAIMVRIVLTVPDALRTVASWGLASNLVSLVCGFIGLIVFVCNWSKLNNFWNRWVVVDGCSTLALP